MGYNVHDVFRKVVTYYTRKHEIKQINSWLWFEIIIIFKDKTLNLQKSTHFQNLIFIQKLFSKKHVMYLKNYNHLL
jgi:hypothetical protein